MDHCIGVSVLHVSWWRVFVFPMITVSDMQTVQNFLKEAYFVINVNHKNLIPLLELTIHSGRPCMIFPFYKNGNVSAYLKKNQVWKIWLVDFFILLILVENALHHEIKRGTEIV